MNQNSERSKKRILIIDDDWMVRTELSQILGSKGYEVTEAEDGISGFSKCTKITSDLVIMDVGLPLVDGHQVSQKFKQDERTASIPILFMTADLVEEQLVKPLKLLGCDYISKPVDLEEFLSRVETLIQKKALKERLKEEYKSGPRKAPEDSDKDPLTGLLTWKAMTMRLEEEIARAERHNIPYSFLVTGLDEIRIKNGSMGQDIVNLIFKEVALIVKKSTRKYNLAGRFEQNMLAITLFHSDDRDSWLAAERLRKQVESQEFRLVGKKVPVTVSIGIFNLDPERLKEIRNQHKDVMQAIISMAKDAMMLAQREGGNRVAICQF